MSYEDTICPCGGKKERDTMLCPQCETDLADHPSMKVFKDMGAGIASGQHAAIVLLALSRSRHRLRGKQPPKFIQQISP